MQKASLNTFTDSFLSPKDNKSLPREEEKEDRQGGVEDEFKGLSHQRINSMEEVQGLGRMNAQNDPP